MADPDLYRTKDEIARWKLRDPIKLLEDHLRAAGQLTDTMASGIDARVATFIDEAVAEAEAGAWEDFDDLEQFVMTRP
jgi:TPP-dependent pyruvate/acetoin dehydrogenase alpha subunit